MIIADTLLATIVSAAVSGGISYGMLRASLGYLERSLERLIVQLDRVALVSATHATALAVLQSQQGKEK